MYSRLPCQGSTSQSRCVFTINALLWMAIENWLETYWLVRLCWTKINCIRISVWKYPHVSRMQSWGLWMHMTGQPAFKQALLQAVRLAWSLKLLSAKLIKSWMTSKARYHPLAIAAEFCQWIVHQQLLVTLSFTCFNIPGDSLSHGSHALMAVSKDHAHSLAHLSSLKPSAHTWW